MVLKEIGKLVEKVEITPDAKKQIMQYIRNFKVAEKKWKEDISKDKNNCLRKARPVTVPKATTVWYSN